MHDSASVSWGGFLVNDNVINSSDDGMHLTALEYWGSDMYGNASFFMGSIRVQRQYHHQ